MTLHLVNSALEALFPLGSLGGCNKSRRYHCPAHLPRQHNTKTRYDCYGNDTWTLDPGQLHSVEKVTSIERSFSSPTHSPRLLSIDIDETDNDHPPARQITCTDSLGHLRTPPSERAIWLHLSFHTRTVRLIQRAGTTERTEHISKSQHSPLRPLLPADARSERMLVRRTSLAQAQTPPRLLRVEVTLAPQHPLRQAMGIRHSRPWRPHMACRRSQLTATQLLRSSLPMDNRNTEPRRAGMRHPSQATKRRNSNSSRVCSSRVCRE